MHLFVDFFVTDSLAKSSYIQCKVSIQLLITYRPNPIKHLTLVQSQLEIINESESLSFWFIYLHSRKSIIGTCTLFLKNNIMPNDISIFPTIYNGAGNNSPPCFQHPVTIYETSLLINATYAYTVKVVFVVILNHKHHICAPSYPNLCTP